MNKQLREACEALQRKCTASQEELKNAAARTQKLIVRAQALEEERTPRYEGLDRVLDGLGVHTEEKDKSSKGRIQALIDRLKEFAVTKH